MFLWCNYIEIQSVFNVDVFFCCSSSQISIDSNKYNSNYKRKNRIKNSCIGFVVYVLGNFEAARALGLKHTRVYKKSALKCLGWRLACQALANLKICHKTYRTLFVSDILHFKLSRMCAHINGWSFTRSHTCTSIMLNFS